jgi:hypothetical protein
MPQRKFGESIWRYHILGMRIELGYGFLLRVTNMAKQQTTRRQKDISRLLREKQQVKKPKPDRPVKKK